MKKYRVYYTVKMNATSYEYYLDVEAQTSKEAVQRVRSQVFSGTKRNAFTPHATKDLEKVHEGAIEGLPPKKPMGV